MDRIQRANLDGTGVQDLVTGLSIPSGITLDPAMGKMYWTSHGTGRIRGANLDGSGIEDLVTGLDMPMYIALGPDVPQAPTSTSIRTEIDDPSAPSLPIRVTLRDWGYEILELVWDPEIEDSSQVAEQVLEPHGRFLLVVFRLENRRSSESSVNAWDFMVEDSIGRTYDVVTLGVSASDSSFNPSYPVANDRGLMRFDEYVQPGRSITAGMLFYIHPNTKDLKLQLFGGLFADSRSISIGDTPSVLMSSPVSDSTPTADSDLTQSPTASLTATLTPDAKAKIESSPPPIPTPNSDNVAGTESQGLPSPAATSLSIGFPPERGAPIGTTLAMLRPGWELTVLSVNPNATDARSFGELWSGWQFLTAWVRITRKDEHSDAWFNPQVMLFARARDKDERNRSHVYGGANENCMAPDALESREFAVGESVEGTVCWKVLQEDASRLVMRGFGSFYTAAPDEPRWQLYE